MTMFLIINNMGGVLRNRLFSGTVINMGLWRKSASTLFNERQTSFKVSSLLLKKHILNPSKDIVRGGTTTVAIKKYESNSKYTGLWKAERFAGIALIFMIPVAFCFESREFEMAIGLVATLHSYWGFQSMCSDYIRSSVVGKLLSVLVRVLNILLALATLRGIHHLIYEDCGFVNMIKKFWAIRGNKEHK